MKLYLYMQPLPSTSIKLSAPAQIVRHQTLIGTLVPGVTKVGDHCESREIPEPSRCQFACLQNAHVHMKTFYANMLEGRMAGEREGITQGSEYSGIWVNLNK